jgi:hypothetical protein
MTWTSVHLTKEAQTILIKAAALQKVSVEDLASKILDEAIQEKLSVSNNSDIEKQPTKALPLAGLQPYAYDATPEESAFPAEEWEVFL